MNANAAMESVKPRFAVDAHLRELFATEEHEEPEPAVDTEPCKAASEHSASLQRGLSRTSWNGGGSLHVSSDAFGSGIVEGGT